MTADAKAATTKVPVESSKAEPTDEQSQEESGAELTIEKLKHEGVNAATAGFVTTLLLEVLGSMNFPFSHKVSALVNQFIEHVLGGIDLKMYAIAAVAGGIAMMFNGALLASFIQERVCKPLLSFLFHSCALVLGTTFAVFISCIWDKTNLAQVRTIIGAFLVVLFLLGETGTVLVGASLNLGDFGKSKKMRIRQRNPLGRFCAAKCRRSFAVESTKRASGHRYH